MLSLGPLSFAAPWALAALAALPVLWWLFRITPPTPRLARFPPVRLLMDLIARDETPAAAPPWLVALRLFLAAALVLAAAGPLLNPSATLRGEGPLILFVDDGWAAATDWPGRRQMMAGLIDQAGRDGKAVAVVPTAAAPAAGGRPTVQLLAPAEARSAAAALQPKPWPTDRRAALKALTGPGGLAGGQPGHVVWLSDGLDDGGAASVLKALKTLGTVSVAADPPGRTVTALAPPAAEGAVLVVTARRLHSRGASARWLRALGEDGAVLDRQRLAFADGELLAEGRLELPAEMRNRLARLEIEDEKNAAAVVLLDERWRRRAVGLVEADGGLEDRPFLSDLYYLEKALAPFAEVRRGSAGELLARDLSVLVLADPGRIGEAERRAIGGWIERGGVLLRFAGPRLAQQGGGQIPGNLLPVPLRRGGRMMGGTMSWNKPAALAPFGERSPFHGLAVPADVRVRRQVLAQPSLDLGDRTWARLGDGTPLVTAAKRGGGWLVLVHTTANAEWSNLPLSGLFMDMLRRLVALSQGVSVKPGGPPLAPLEVLDGFGRPMAPPAGALPIDAEAFEKTPAGADHPPGYYGDKSARRALNLSAGLTELRPLVPSGVSRLTFGKSREVDLTPWLLALALALAVADLAASLALRGLLGRSLAAGLALAVLAAPAKAKAGGGDDFALAASLQTRFAYVITGEDAVDETSRSGLAGLAVIVRRRTAADLGDPLGVDPETDELSFFPLLYWPLTSRQGALSPEAAAKLNRYLVNGGTILFDTRGEAGGPGPAGLEDLARQLDIPPLAPVPPNHVLRQSFYLIGEFPGRWRGGTVWIERAGERINDGVSSVIAGGHDWAAAWAMDDAQLPLFAAVPGGERQREMAFRFGINLVMYVLTGNYKADQVHLKAILERLGR